MNGEQFVGIPNIQFVYNGYLPGLSGNLQAEQTKRYEPMQPNLSRLILLYLRNASVDKKTAKANSRSLLRILDVVKGAKVRPENIELSELSPALIRNYQAQMVEAYCKAAPPDHQSQREAKERALRTSRSVIAQARSLFARRSNDIREIYRENGIEIPTCVNEFCACTVKGQSTKREYRAPTDEVVQRSMENIELMKADRDVYLGFWFAIGACLRKSEIKYLCWQHVVEVDGQPRVMGGTRKNGFLLDVPMQSRAYKAILPFKETTGFVIRERGDRWARRLSFWMRGMGWSTQKTLHELRAYTGSQLYMKVSPVVAMRILGHSSIQVTEKNYLRYGLKADKVDVL